MCQILYELALLSLLNVFALVGILKNIASDTFYNEF
jgi:hypothetical protein